jgi:hypothetical protein
MKLFRIGEVVECVAEAPATAKRFYPGRIGEVLTISDITSTGGLVFLEYPKAEGASAGRFVHYYGKTPSRPAPSAVSLKGICTCGGDKVQAGHSNWCDK